MQNSQPLFNSIENSCQRIGIRKTRIYELISEGRLKVVKLGKRTLIPEAELQRFAEELTRQGSLGRAMNPKKTGQG